MKPSLAKRFVTIALALLPVAFAMGCPVYSDQVLGCTYATDCPIGYSCGADGRCVAGPPFGGAGSAGRDSGPSDATTERPADARAGDASGVVYCGNPADCAADQTCSTDGTCHAGDYTMSACINQFDCATTSKGPVCVHGDVHACGADRQCSTTERCVDGLCVALTELCSDETQCPSSKLCVDGKCTSGCTTDPQCPAGFACRLALGVCNVASKPCALTNDCASKDLVCVDGACVPRCATRGSCADAAGTCVDNGCVPNQGVVVQCNGQGASADCQSGQVCLHHHCYVSSALPVRAMPCAAPQ